MGGADVLIRLVAITMLATGCVNIPPFKVDAAPPGDGPRDASGPPVDAPTFCAPDAPLHHFREENLYEVVCGPHYAMRFSDEGAHYPRSFLVDGIEMIAAAPNPIPDACNERLMGVAAYPSHLMVGRGQTLGNDPVYELDGRAAIKLSLSWNQETCGSSTADTDAGVPSVLEGLSTFTFFPDGRIVRFDDLKGPDAFHSRTTCSCGAQPWRMTSFLTMPFANLTFDNGLNIPSMGMEVPLLANGGNDALYACARASDETWALSMGWSEGEGRVRRVDATSVAVVFDMSATANQTLPATWFGQADQTLLVRQPQEASCQMARLREHTERMERPIRVNGLTTTTTLVESLLLGHDGIYGGEYDERNQRPIVVPATESGVQLTPPAGGGVPRGFAVKLHFEAGGETFVIRRGATTLVDRTDYELQINSTTFDRPPSGTNVTVWFRAALPQENTIDIERVP